MTPILRAAAIVVALLLVVWVPTAGAARERAPGTIQRPGLVVRLAHPKVVAGLIATTATGPEDAVLAQALALGGGAPGGAVAALHPDGEVLFVVADGLHGRRGLLRVVTADAQKPAVISEIPLSPGLVPGDIALDADQGRLYVASGTHTVVLDVAVPSVPQVVGRIADVMIAAHDRIHLQSVADQVFGRRTLLSVTTDFAGGDGCRPGALHVLDVSGRLQDAPIEIVRTTAPISDDVAACPVPSVHIDADRRRMRVDWVAAGASIRTDTAPYDITSAFQASATLCRLVRV
ncbi:MAG TPA: hypothetical protein VMM13_01960 [Euzebya sp.]|nr:hypothetical protein [Euzebya sp.]